MIKFEYEYIKIKKQIAFGLMGWRYEYYKRAVALIVRSSRHYSKSEVDFYELERISKEEFDAGKAEDFNQLGEGLL